jgi:hypothetical protein
MRRKEQERQKVRFPYKPDPQNCLGNGFLFVSKYLNSRVADPDPIWIQDGKNDPQKYEKIKKFFFSS